MLGFGSIVLTRFPFTDLSADKLRPGPGEFKGQRTAQRCGLWRSSPRTSRQPTILTPCASSPSTTNGLKVPSVVRFDKVVTPEKADYRWEGSAMQEKKRFLDSTAAVFFGVFGFGNS